MKLINSPHNSENDWLVIPWQVLTPFMINVPILCPPENTREGFLAFSRHMREENWSEMG